MLLVGMDNNALEKEDFMKVLVVLLAIMLLLGTAGCSMTEKGTVLGALGGAGLGAGIGSISGSAGAGAAIGGAGGAVVGAIIGHNMEE